MEDVREPVFPTLFLMLEVGLFALLLAATVSNAVVIRLLVMTR